MVLTPRWPLSRPCYDKPHRCPGWAGAGLGHAPVSRCDNGRIIVPHRDRGEAVLAALDGTLGHHPAERPLRFGRCTRCHVVTLPWVSRRLDPTLWRNKVRWSARKAGWKVRRGFWTVAALRRAWHDRHPLKNGDT